ncbi:hypothetical protein C7B77_18060 [Chamaesiphon polymorphus CCALA 037]|uniref:Uncharacterized protein n=2 Tax=Chamaesiphon TaxID=217161 RepID=A0A2T1GB12_9CYAN|nr:hypothetical protein C7B77_18060 [Chamaesiphon polymorphus CCALA 037]
MTFLDFMKEKCLQVKDDSYFDDIEDYVIYAKEFDNLDSVIDCIYEIEKTWKNSNKKETLWVDGVTEYERCNSIMIYNQWKNHLTINIYLDRWMLSGISSLTNEWKENLKNAKGEINRIYSKVVEWKSNDESEFISRQKACSLLKKWLRTNDWEGDFDHKEYCNYRHEYYYIYNKTTLQDDFFSNDDTVPF